MGKKEDLKALYERVDNVRPFAEKDGELYVSFDDAATLNSYNADEPKTGMQTRNPDGTLAKTGKTVHAVNPDYFFANRYKVKGKKMHVVSGHEPIGFRCIREQARGRCPVKAVPVYVISRNAEGKLVVDKLTTVPDTEFIADFTNTLTNQAMAEVLPIITAYGTAMTADTMPI